jgi:hypothetical protein
MASKRFRPLVTGAIWVVVFLVLRAVLPLLLPATAGQAAWFIAGFLAILMAFIFFGVVFVSRELSGRFPYRVYDLVEKIIIAGILLGVVGMFQPWVHALYRIGFYSVFISFLAFNVWSHVTPKGVHNNEYE